MAMRLNLPDGSFIEVEAIMGGVSVAQFDKMGYGKRRDRFTNDELVQICNLLCALRDNRQNTVYAASADSCDLHPFKILQ
jgi:hypothetical protein